MLSGVRTALALVGVYALLLYLGIDPLTAGLDWLTQEISINIWPW